MNFQPSGDKNRPLTFKPLLQLLILVAFVFADPYISYVYNFPHLINSFEIPLLLLGFFYQIKLYWISGDLVIGVALWEILSCLQSSRSGMQGHSTAYEPLIRKKRPLSLCLSPFCFISCCPTHFLSLSVSLLRSCVFICTFFCSGPPVHFCEKKAHSRLHAKHLIYMQKSTYSSIDTFLASKVDF